MRRLSISLIAAAVVAAGIGTAFAQTRVRTEFVRGPKLQQAAKSTAKSETITGSVTDQKTLTPAQNEGALEIITDAARLPPPVNAMRARILAIARSGQLRPLVALMRSSSAMPVFSLNDDVKDPFAYWRTTYPDSDGVEVLATLIDILEAGCVHVDAGGPGDMYIWPYFARLSPQALTAEQKVELFKIVTGSDYKEMIAFGAYNFFRLGISPDGAWRFFVTGD